MVVAGQRSLRRNGSEWKIRTDKMADLGFGGRVLAGEDSEEDEEEEELGFQFNRAPAPVHVPTSIQPKFSVQAPVASHEEDESDEDEQNKDGEGGVAVPEEGSSPAAPGVMEQLDDCAGRVSIDSSVRSISRPGTPELPLSQRGSFVQPAIKRDEEPWRVDESVDGAAMMGHAILQKLEPSLDTTIRRIAELTDSQQRLLSLLSSQHNSICSNDQIENVAIVMGKLPQYIKKVQDIKAAMSEISSSVDRMKKRSESLRVDAQSHAIKKENKRESLSQWNKLYAAKSFEGVTMSSTSMSGGFPSAAPPRPPSAM